MNKSKGIDIEKRASKWLESQGVSIVDRNYHCRMGEIDIVGRHQHTLIFVEVRYRSNDTFGGALASVDARKQRKIIKAAKHYITAKNLWHLNCRFDVIAVTDKSSKPTFSAQWFQGAFTYDAISNRYYD